MRASICVLLFVVIALSQSSAEEPAKYPLMDDGREIMTVSNDVVRSLRAISYDAEAQVGSPQTPEGLKITGKVTISSADRTKAGKYLMDVEIVAPRNEALNGKVTVAGTGSEFFVIDHNGKTFQHASNPAMLPASAHLASPVIWPEFMHPQPFGDELKGSVELSGAEDVNGVDCYKILVRYQRGGQTATWWIGKQDLIPRRCEKNVGQEPNLVKQLCTISNVRANPELKEEQFTLTAPEGFSKFEPRKPDR